jgi:hypothetical protein
LVKLFKEQTMPQFSDDLFLGPAITYMGTGNRPYTTTFTGSISTTSLNVTALLQGSQITLGMYVDGTNVTDGTYITAFGTGTGGTGTYTVSTSSTATSTTMYGHTNIPFDDPAPMDLGVGPLGRIYVWDIIPQTLQTNNIAASQTPAAAGALTLTAGTSVKSTTTPLGAAVLALDIPRAVSITQAASGTQRTFTVSGYDYYGQAMSEAITSTVGSTVTGKKAFFLISSVTVAGGGTTTAVTVGTGDVFGCPVRFFDKSYIVRYGWNNGTTDDTSGVLTVADTATATTTTGDVRGTFAPSTAADGIKRAVVTIALPAIAVGPNATRTGALGVTQA